MKENNYTFESYPNNITAWGDMKIEDINND